MKVNIPWLWNKSLQTEFNQVYFRDIIAQIDSALGSKEIIYPATKDIFRAFEQTPFEAIKVVILGQDPYHRAEQAEGLAFSVPKGVKIPASLHTIFKELCADLSDFTAPQDGCLQSWAAQGVFLLNTILTVRAGHPGSHKGIGWQRFTNAVIHSISQQRKGVVFLLWGNYAKSKKYLIDNTQHFVLEAAHPSPLARGAFLGCRHFSQTNQLLIGQGLRGINWSL